jgi:hypothetical protein
MATAQAGDSVERGPGGEQVSHNFSSHLALLIAVLGGDGAEKGGGKSKVLSRRHVDV